MPIQTPTRTEIDNGTAIASSSGTATNTATAAVAETPKSFFHLLNLSLGFLGIQFAWMIQIGQMSPLLESLGSVPWLTSLIWCAGPVTGVVVQPIVGSLSDKTWTFLGRRRPFLLAGAILTATCLVLMPNSPSLFVAAALLWVLDASINVSQGPYRALVPDTIPASQQAFTYALMSLTIGLGSVLATFIGTQLTDMHQLFYLGAIAMLAAMLWTIITNPEKARPESQTSNDGQSGGFINFIQQTFQSIVDMPKETKKLCLMHSFTWFGLQCMFIFFSLFVGHNLFHITDPNSPMQVEIGHQIMQAYLAMNIVCFAVSPFLGKLFDVVSKKALHTVGLLCLASGLIATYFITEPWQATAVMAVIGVGWATTLSVPFAILAKQVPAGKEGVLMGTFNIFIAAPQFIASALAGLVVTQTHNDASALLLGGASVLLSALLLQWVKE